ncbi:MAG: hypothetical protein ACK53I_02255 [Phenylobacterium sp.]|jgi:hypothetical protein
MPDTTLPRIVEIGKREALGFRPAVKGGGPAVQLQALTLIASHSDAWSVAGRPLVVPLDRLTALIEALDAVRREVLEAGQ